MNTNRWAVHVIADIIQSLDTVRYDVARCHLYDAIAAINAVDSNRNYDEPDYVAAMRILPPVN